MDRPWVYLLTDLGKVEARTEGWEGVRGLLGGKGANLADMMRQGLPVPPGFTVTTEACIAYLDGGETLAPDIWAQIEDAIRRIEEATGKAFGDPANPLLVSCRSGSKFSMPGMMDTILNLGMNDEVAEGVANLSGDERFAFDSYRRLVQMYGLVVKGMGDQAFEKVIAERRRASGVSSDADLGADDWRQVTEAFKELVRRDTGAEFPQDPRVQLRGATEAVFRSWNGKRAVDYRNAVEIPHDLGTAVNVQAMVFGNMGDDSVTGVAMSRNSSTGEPGLEGDFLVNAQGEDVVAGIRQTLPIGTMEARFPEAYRKLVGIAEALERRYRDMQDMEFTVERSTLWLLQTRDAKRTAQAEVRIAVDMVDEGLISRDEAVLRVSPDQLSFFLHPQFDESARRAARLVAEGLNVSPGAAVGVVALDADTAERWGGQEGKDVIMVRPETRPDDVHGMLAARGILTSRGGRTSHAALVARQFGKPAVVGVEDLDIDLEAREIRVGGDLVIREGEAISIDGERGQIYLGRVATIVPDVRDQWLSRLLDWADEIRRLGVWTNADYPRDAHRGRENGAQGIGLCRTEHMFFEEDRLPIMRDMIMARSPHDRLEALDKLLPYQRMDFEGLFRVMDGLPVVVRLLDPPLHEFLPSYEGLLVETAELRARMRTSKDPAELESVSAELQAKVRLLERTESLRESNPMLGTRGCRLGILLPELTRMQARALFEAAATCLEDGVDVKMEIMIPLVAHVEELRTQRAEVEAVGREVMAERGIEIPFKLGTMIEVPRAALTADQIADVAEFFSFGTNDLTQTVFAISRDDAEAGFVAAYVQRKIFPENPFATLDPEGVGRLMGTALELGRRVRPDLEVGICGEHGGDPKSIELCHRLGLDYVSCSPYRVPVARLAAAQAALRHAATEPAGRPREAVGVAR